MDAQPTRPLPPPPPAPPAPTAAGQEALDAFYTGAVRIRDGIRAPRVVKDVRPVYPPAVFAADIQGAVVLLARVEPEGHVSQVLVTRSLPELDHAAVDAARQWEFVNDALLNGKPVAVIVELEFTFTKK
jgi:protein TonB